MAGTLEELDALEAAINVGALRVKYQDRDVTYRSLEEMRSIRDELREQLGVEASIERRRVWTFNRGT